MYALKAFDAWACLSDSTALRDVGVEELIAQPAH